MEESFQYSRSAKVLKHELQISERTSKWPYTFVDASSCNHQSAEIKTPTPINPPNANPTIILQLQHPLPSQLNLPLRLRLLPPALTHTDRTPLAQLHFVLNSRKRTRAVMWKVYASESARAEVVRTVRCY